MTTSLLLLARKVRVRNLFLFIIVFLITVSFETINAQAPVPRVNCTVEEVYDPLGTPGVTLDPLSVPMYENDLPVILDLNLRIDATAGGNFNMKMGEVTQDLLGMGFSTKVWGYGPSNGVVTYPGPTFVTMRDVPITAIFENNLPLSGQFLPVDPSMHMAHPANLHTTGEVAAWYAGGKVPTVAHLHGGHTESASDGLPEQWYTQGFAEVGAQFVKQKFTYHNDQEAATLWYHDHALGITRLNVYAGLAGFYLLRDANENNLIANNVLPSGPQEIEIVIQDRLFDTNGQLFWPAYPGETPWDEFIDQDAFPNGYPDGVPPSALAEFFGNVILVNGKAWPKLQVEPRKYRFRLLNGSDSRFYILRLNDPYDGEAMEERLDDDGKILVIGTDDGLLYNPVEVQELAIAPGERYDIVIDFSTKSGQSINLINNGPDAPAGGFDVDTDDMACFGTTGQIMQFQVNLASTIPAGGIDATVNPGTILRAPIVQLTPTQLNNPRQLVLFEGKDQYGRLQPMLGTMAEGSQTWFEPITENPMLNDIEVWEVYNATGDAHPIHLHLVSFQILEREEFTPYTDLTLGIEENLKFKYQIQHNSEPGDPNTDAAVAETYGQGGTFHLNPINPFVPMSISGPAAHESGWKDTFIVPPGTVGRVIARFDRPGRYVWHCHILSHEDHEMMRPFFVGNMPRKAGQFAKEGYALSDPFKNPIAIGESSNFTFNIPEKLPVTYRIYNSITGNIVYSSDTRFYPIGDNQMVEIPYIFTQAGDYILAFYAGDFYDFGRIKVR